MILKEWRWFIVDNKIIDGSVYRLRGRLHKQHEDNFDVCEEAQKLADLWLPHKNCVMDVALVDNKLKIIEFNNLNSSGFYNHNIEKIILAVNESS